MKDKPATETYYVKQKDGSTRQYTRVTREVQIELDQRNRERGLEKEYFQLANGHRGFRWR